MKRRRGHGEGAIYQRPDGRWVGMLNLGWADGKRRRRAVYGVTRREVQDRLDAIRRDYEAGMLVGADAEKLGPFLQRWLQDTARHTLAPRTFIRYEQLVRTHVLPDLGDVALRRLQAQHLARLYSRKLEAGKAPRTVQFVHAVLHRALRQAVRWNLIARNPADLVTAPRPVRPTLRVLSPSEAQELLVAARGNPLEGLFVLAVTTGMRQGELLALRWPDVDLEAGRLAVHHGLVRIGQEWTLAEPKSAKSRRNLCLSDVAIAALRTHRAAQRASVLALPDRDFVFRDGQGEPLQARYVVARLHELLRATRLPVVRFHDLRHTAATLMLSEGVHPKIVQEMLGHSTVYLTLDVYSHLLPNLQDQAADAIDRLFGSAASS